MASIDISRKHSLGLEAARGAAEKVAQSLKEQLDASYSWKGDNLVWQRTGAKGEIRVSESEVRVLAELSFLLRPLKGKIEGKVHEYLDEYLRPDQG